MRRLIAAAVLALLAGACAGDDAPVVSALPTREIAAGEVTVTVTPVRIDERGAEFDVAFDTHSVDLDLDVAAGAALIVDGDDWPDPVWEGAGAGGHHREGTLRFAADGTPSGEAVLTIRGLEAPATASWDLQARGG